VRRPQSLAPVAGLAFAVVLLLSTALSPGGASSNDPPAKIAAYYLHHGRGDIAADYGSLLATGLLLLVFCIAAGRLPATAARLLLATAALAAGFELAATAIEMALAANVHQHAPAGTTAALYQVASRLFMLSTLAIGASVGLAASGEPRRWLRRLGGVAAALLTVAGLSAAHPHGPLSVALIPGWLLLAVWAVAGSVSVLRAGRPQVAAGAPA
jgi:hypothetical protein